MVDLTVIRPKDDGPPRLLVQATALDLAEYERVRPGKLAFAAVTFKRSVPHLRWYRGLVGVVAEAIGMHPNALHAELKFKAGFIKQYLLNRGKLIIELQSVSFATMDEGEFTDFRVNAVTILFRDYLPGVDRKDVWDKVEELCGPCPW